MVARQTAMQLVGAAALLLLRPIATPPPRAAASAFCAADSTWNKRINELREYKAAWGNADATLETPLGKWCATQRTLRSEGKLSDARLAELAALGFSWVSPTDGDVISRCDWDEMCARLTAYIAENGNAQVPKKYKQDPQLGGWVATVRRTHGNGLGDARNAQLEAIGFEWVSTRKCGSAFMENFRELRSYWEQHGTTEVAADGAEEAAAAALIKWSDAQRSARQKGKLSDERVAYLDGLGFRW